MSRENRRSIGLIERLETRELLTLTVNNLSATEGVPLPAMTKVASFLMGDVQGSQTTDFTASINWGNGSVTTGSDVADGDACDIEGSTTNTTATTAGAPDPVTLTVVGLNDSSATATGSATVAQAALTSQGMNINPAKGASFNLVVADFQDANTLLNPGNFTASINWGDGTAATPGQIALVAPGMFTVQGPHAYATAGSFPITTTITYQAGAVTIANSIASVPSALPPFSTNGGLVLASQGVAILSTTRIGVVTNNSRQLFTASHGLDQLGRRPHVRGHA